VLEDRRRLRLALPFAVLTDDDAVHLVAGEDFRYRLSGTGLGDWLPSFLRALDGTTSAEALIAALPGAEHERAHALVVQLLGERVLVEATPERAPERVVLPARVHGNGTLAAALGRALAAPGHGDPALHVFCQDTLDEGAALAFNAERLSDGAPWIWVSTGALSRAYVGPVFLPWRGPCYGCLVAAFERLSPVPELRRALQAHCARGAELPHAELPSSVLELVSQVTRWKLDACAAPEAVAAAYVLHVLELGSLEMTLHPVPVDADCTARCRERRSARRAGV
jgi:bacteriocin biosynthesis cyclodehydratase domain-containing protein